MARDNNNNRRGNRQNGARQNDNGPTDNSRRGAPYPPRRRHQNRQAQNGPAANNAQAMVQNVVQNPPIVPPAPALVDNAARPIMTDVFRTILEQSVRDFSAAMSAATRQIVDAINVASERNCQAIQALDRTVEDVYKETYFIAGCFEKEEPKGKEGDDQKDENGEDPPVENATNGGKIDGA